MAAVALRTLAHETLVVELAVNRLVSGLALDESEIARLKDAAERVRTIAELVT
jgi:hypothetical protein